MTAVTSDEMLYFFGLPFSTYEITNYKKSRVSFG